MSAHTSCTLSGPGWALASGTGMGHSEPRLLVTASSHIVWPQISDYASVCPVGTRGPLGKWAQLPPAGLPTPSVSVCVCLSQDRPRVHSGQTQEVAPGVKVGVHPLTYQRSGATLPAWCQDPMAMLGAPQTGWNLACRHSRGSAHLGPWTWKCLRSRGWSFPGPWENPTHMGTHNTACMHNTHLQTHVHTNTRVNT